MAELIIHSGIHQGKRLILPEKELVVGRDDECQMKLASNLVSRRHCLLNVTPDGILVTDLKSQNGTYVNDILVTEPQLLQPGDVLRIGAALFQVPPLPKSFALKRKSEKISDADIADWLSDDDSPAEVRRGDTTVISGRSSIAEASPNSDARAAGQSGDSAIRPKAVASDSADGSSKPSAPVKPQIRTVKEEAQEIIKQHFESMKAKRSE